MAKLYKSEIYILDIDERYDNLQDIANHIESQMDVFISPFSVKETHIDWYDDIDINKIGCKLQNFRQYFK